MRGDFCAGKVPRFFATGILLVASAATLLRVLRAGVTGLQTRFSGFCLSSDARECTHISPSETGENRRFGELIAEIFTSAMSLSRSVSDVKGSMLTWVVLVMYDDSPKLWTTGSS